MITIINVKWHCQLLVCFIIAVVFFVVVVSFRNSEYDDKTTDIPSVTLMLPEVVVNLIIIRSPSRKPP